MLSLSTAASLFGLWCLWAFLFREQRTDVFRQEVFRLRDELFDHASSDNTNINFDHPAYGYLRSTLIGFIRCADYLTVIRAVALLRVAQHVPDHRRTPDPLPDLMMDLNEEDRKFLEVTNNAMHLAVFRKIVFSSILLTVATAPLFVLMRSTSLLVGLMKRPVSRLDAVAYQEGMDHSSARHPIRRGDRMAHAF